MNPTVDDHFLDSARRVRIRPVRIFLVLLLTATVGGFAWIHIEQRRLRTERRQTFLEHFEQSFTSGLVTLTAEPQIESVEENWPRYVRLLPLKVPDEYRITAPVVGPGGPAWQVWSYGCSDQSNSFVFMYSNAQAPSRAALKSPPKAYVEASARLVDGAPSTTGATATIVSLPDPAPIQQPIQLVLQLPPGARSEVELFPKGAVETSPTMLPSDVPGQVIWTWKCWPMKDARSLQVVIRCIEPRGKAEMVSTAVRTISLLHSSEQSSNARE